MATNEEILDIILQIQATGLAEADAVNQILANTGSVAQGTTVQVNAMSDAHESLGRQVEKTGLQLQTANTFNTSYGETLTAQEAHYANLQLSSKEFAAAERDVTRDGIQTARMFSAAGAEAANLTDRVAALGGVMGSGGALGIGIGATLVGAGLAVEAGRSMISNADQNEAAQKNVAQAAANTGMSFSQVQSQIDTFIAKNSKFISNQYDVKNAFADSMRAGFDWNTTLRVVNDALDMSAINGKSVQDNVDELISAHEGDARALKDLGINTKDLEDPTKALAKAQKEVKTATDEHTKAERELAEWEVKHHDRSKLTAADLMHEQDLKAKVSKSTQDLATANQDQAAAQQAAKDKGDQFQQLLDLLEPKIAKARDNTTDLKQSQDDLNTAWENASDRYGPDLESWMTNIQTAASDAMQITDLWFQLLGSPAIWGGINDQIIMTVKGIQQIGSAIGDVVNGLNTLAGHPGGQTGPHYRTPSPSQQRQRGFAPGTAPIGPH